MYKEIKNKNILVTGGAGFIGSNLVDRLVCDNNIFVIDNFNNYYNPIIKQNNIIHNINKSNYKLYRIDICNFDLLKEIFSENNIDIVIHLAAIPGVRQSFENPCDYVKNNIEGTINILESMKLNNIKKIIFASSSSVYGNCDKMLFSENLKADKPISPYAATKLACEEFLYSYAQIYHIKTVCLRFFTVYGPRQRPDLAIRKFVDLINQNKPIPVYGCGNTIRDYTYIDDIVDGICSAINYDETNFEIINLGGNSAIKLSDMIKIIETLLGKKAIIEKYPMQTGDVFRTQCDITKAAKLLNYQPKMDFYTGMKKFVKWYNDNNIPAETLSNSF